MIHVSPCGWYCFEAASENRWQVEDTREQTVLRDKTGTCSIEMLSARRMAGEASSEETCDLQEQYLRTTRIQPLRTTLGENPFRVNILVTRGTGADGRLRLLCHAFWGNYLIFIQYTGLGGEDSQEGKQMFYEVINSLQPLALG